MAVDYMNSACVNDKYPGSEGKAWEYEEELQNNVNGKVLIIPPNVQSVAVTLEIYGTASGKVQATTNKLQDVLNEASNVVWVDWDNGVLANTAQDFVYPCTAIRLVKTSGAETTERVRIYVRAQ